MKFYIAAWFGQQEEARKFAEKLQNEYGLECTSRWLQDEPAGNDFSTSNYGVWPARAKKDLEDLIAADIFVFVGGQVSATGGKHVEFGYALALHKQIIVVNERENLFHWLPGVTFAKDWDQLGLMLQFYANLPADERDWDRVAAMIPNAQG